MALTVETGSGSATSESYESVINATTYHTLRGNVAWAALASDALREQALRRATDYMTQTYRMRWKGFRTHQATQSLDWPRENVYIDDSGIKTYVLSNTVPTEVKNACCELALMSLDGDLAPNIERETSSESVGGISVAYFQGSKQFTTYRSVDMMLAPLFKNAGNGIQVIRA